jgi:hypothetical protein
MDVSGGHVLIPIPGAIPAPWGVFEFLDILTFIVHLLLMNMVVGGSIILLFSRLKRSISNGQGAPTIGGPAEALVNNIPSALALTITFGVAPLLFIQVLYGHFIYSSSVLMAVYWLLVVPLLIIAYYGVYIFARKSGTRGLLPMAVISASCVIFLYVMWTFVNNMTLMLHPENWAEYFNRRGGTILNTGDPTVWPRFLHFLVASVAVAGLISSLIWWIRKKRSNADASADNKVKSGLKIFSYATALQVGIGIWFLVALPREILLKLMGGDPLFTVIFILGFAAVIAVLVTGFLGKLAATSWLLLVTVILMVINRANLRTLYLEPYFSPGSLENTPQYSVMFLFFLVLVAGLAAVGYMLKVSFQTAEGGAK